MYIFTSAVNRLGSTMQKLNTPFTVSASEIRGFSKAIEKSHGQPVAVLNHNKVQGYIVPAEAIQPIEYASTREADVALQAILQSDQQILEHLKDQ